MERLSHSLSLDGRPGLCFLLSTTGLAIGLLHAYICLLLKIVCTYQVIAFLLCQGLGKDIIGEEKFQLVSYSVSDPKTY